VKTELQALIQEAQKGKENATRRQAIIALGYEQAPEVYSVLLEQLKDPSPSIQQAAIISLGRHGNPMALQELTKPKILRSPHVDVRWAAVSAIGQLGDYRAIEWLLRAVNDEEWRVRDQAINELRKKIVEIYQHRERRAVPLLIHLLDLENVDIVEWVIEGLSAMPEESTEPLLSTLNTSSPRMRANAVKAIGQMGILKAIPELKKCFFDPNARVRKEAISALGKMKDSESIEWIVNAMEDNVAEVQQQAMKTLVEFGALATEPILNNLRHIQNKYVTRAMLLTLGEIGDPRAIPVIQQYLRSTYFVVRMAAVKALVPFGSKAVPSLVEMLSFPTMNIRSLLNDVLRGKNRSAQIRAIRALGALEDHRAVPILKQLIRKGDREIVQNAESALFSIGTAAWGRCSALICLREIGDPSALPAIIHSLEDPSENVRLEAIRALGKFPPESTVSHLIKVFHREKSAYLKSEVLAALRRSGASGKELSRLGLVALKEKDWTVRAQACGLLGNLVERQAIGPLIQCLGDPHWSVQESAENALHNFGALAIPKLIHALRNPSKTIRLRAVRLLGEIGNKNVLSVLNKLIQNPSEKKPICEAAKEAIKKIEQREGQTK